MSMKTEMTPQQAITLYQTIEALMNQFDRDNDPSRSGDCGWCAAVDSVRNYRCKKCNFIGAPRGHCSSHDKVPNEEVCQPEGGKKL